MKTKYTYNAPYRETQPDVETDNLGVPGTPTSEQDDVGPKEVELSLWEELSQDIVDEETLESNDPEETPETPEDSPKDADPKPETSPEKEEEPPAPEPEPEPEPEPTPDSSKEEVTPKETEKPKPLTQEELAAQRKQFRDALAQELKLDDEEASQLVLNPGEVMPKILARTYEHLFLRVMDTIRTNLPAAIEQTNQAVKQREESISKFFNSWPDLNRETHGADVAQAAAIYQQMRPDASDEEVIKNVGLQVMAIHGIVPSNLQVSDSQDPPDVPPSPRRPPAVNGGGSTPPVRSGNIFESLADEMIVEDNLE